MRIFLATHRAPWPPFKGSQVRPFNILKALADRGHEVHLFSFANEGDPTAATRQLRQWCSDVHLAAFSERAALARTALAVLSGRCLSEAWFASRGLRRAISRAMDCHPPTAFFVYSSSMAQYVPGHFRSRSVIDIGDVDSKKWADLAPKAAAPRSVAYAIEARRLRKHEYRIVREFGFTNLATKKEAELLTDLSTTDREKIISITNGTDLEYFRPDATADANPNVLPENERRFLSGARHRICFTGAMDYQPNVEAAIFFSSEVLPVIRQSFPEAEFLIVGSNPTYAVLQLESLPGVRVTGFVQDARPYFKGCQVYVAPLLMARGIQNKVLEAMACGCAIVTTSTVAEGVGAVRGQQLLIADSPTEMARLTIQLLNSPELRQSLGCNARQYVERGFGWKPLMDELITYVEEAARRSR